GKLPKAVIVVNLYGQSADMTPLLAVCDHYGVPMIEDAAESLGATYKGKASGTFGRFGVYSFNGNKIITTSGGGMLVSDNMEALEKARFWSTQARDPALHYQHSEMGYNYRMSNLLAAVGRGQLRVLDSHVKACRHIFRQYHQALSDIEGFDFMPEASYGLSNQWLTVLTVDPERCGVTSNEIIDALDKQNIEARPVWKPMQPLFNPQITQIDADYKKAKKNKWLTQRRKGARAQRKCAYYPHGIGESVCEGLFERGLCLPSGTAMMEGDIDRVVEVMLNCKKSY
ncbi:MAG: DegT/DnrJ/EryC1/StrS family aminotransferase, partial [Deltaproteobacteria bacterium]|nr:DegT/DnrJ/EryC1/StrS family aminotransferase [Deltaproteobacteria bacterium]